MRIDDTGDLWWRNAVVYCLDVETYLDADGDGCGDLPGLMRRLDHLDGLGVTCLWLMPFFPSPNRDDGYDIVDHHGVDPRLGSPGDLVELVRTASDRGIRVIIDLVVNHVSAEHPWFQAARADRGSRFRDFFVWADTPPEGDGEVVFPDQETSNWGWDAQAGQHFLHRFYGHQPDLNITNPSVRDEIAKVIGYWLQQGVAGFRVDAVPFLLETGHDVGAGADPIGEDAHQYLRDLRAVLGRRRGDAVLLGEVNLPPSQQRRFFGERGDELHLVFNFVVNQAMYLALARRDAGPLRDALRSLPPIPDDCAWASFVRNHDELTLDQLGEGERAEVFAAFGPEERMQLFERGLRRRLPPMLGGDAARIATVYSLMFALPGTPVLFYGEEIGMGENLDVPGRMSVRTPMQWAPGPTGGFSAADPSRLRRPPPEGAFGPDAVNVADQRRDPASLLSFMERLARRRRECPEIGWGTWRVLDTGAPAVLGIAYDASADTPRRLVTLHNLGAAPAEVLVDAAAVGGAERLTEIWGGDTRHRPGVDGRVRLRLEGNGHRWLRPHARGEEPELDSPTAPARSPAERG